MSTFAFVSYEIHPTTWGGCGVLLHNAANVLLESGHSVILLLDIPRDYFDRFQQQDRQTFPCWKNLRAYLVEDLADMDLEQKDFASPFDYNAYRFHLAAKRLSEIEPVDLIEFFDYCGPAFYALRVKMAGLAYQNTTLAIRLHNSLEVMDACEGTTIHDIQRYYVFALEHGALRWSEAILYPGQCYLEEAYRPFYGEWIGRTFPSKPPLVKWPALTESAEAERKRRLLFYGRLFSWKGPDLFVDAAVAYLNTRDGESSDVLFTLVGYDSNSPPGGIGSYTEYLTHKIPPRLRNRFEFKGQVSWTQLEEMLPTVLCGVFPSYFESFCYAAHELYAAGIPLLVSNIPAFREYFRDGENALVFDCTVQSLNNALARVIGDAALRDRITRPTLLNKDPLGDFYEHLPELAKEISIAPNTLPLMQKKPSVLILVLADKEVCTKTLASIDAQETAADIQVISACSNVCEEDTSFWLFGMNRVFVERTGKRLIPSDVLLPDALLVLRDGDIINERFVDLGTTILADHPKVGFAGTWCEVRSEKGTNVNTFPVDSLCEAIPFLSQGGHPRHMMRTESGCLLVDFFDARLGPWGEVGRLMEFEDDGLYGVTIPERYVSVLPYETPRDWRILSYLTIRDHNLRRGRKLARLLAARSQTLQHEESNDATLRADSDTGLSGNVVDVLFSLAKKIQRVHAAHPKLRKPIRAVYLMIKRFAKRSK